MQLHSLGCTLGFVGPLSKDTCQHQNKLEVARTIFYWDNTFPVVHTIYNSLFLISKSGPHGPITLERFASLLEAKLERFYCNNKGN